jgi:hypothetical protein
MTPWFRIGPRVPRHSYGATSDRETLNNNTYNISLPFLYTPPRLGISSCFLNPWFFTPPTNKLNFPLCFLPKLSFHPPLFFNLWVCSRHQCDKIFLTGSLPKKEANADLSFEKHAVLFSRSGLSPLPDRGYSLLHLWPTFSPSPVFCREKKCKQIGQGVTCFHLLPEQAGGLKHRMNTPLYPNLGERALLVEGWALCRIFFCSFLFYCFLFILRHWAVLSQNSCTDII